MHGSPTMAILWPAFLGANQAWPISGWGGEMGQGSTPLDKNLLRATPLTPLLLVFYHFDFFGLVSNLHHCVMNETIIKLMIKGLKSILIPH